MPVSNKPNPKLRQRRLPANSREIASVLKSLKKKQELDLAIRMADFSDRRAAGLLGERQVTPDPLRFPKPTAQNQNKITKESKQVLGEFQRRLAPSYAAMDYAIEEQSARVRAMKRYSKRLFGTIGDPTLFDFIDVADSVTFTTTRTTSAGGSVFLTPPAPTSAAGPFANLVKFSALVVSPPALFEFALFQITATYIFSFESWLNAVCTLSAALQPNGVFRLVVPGSSYVFPTSHTIPHADVAFSARFQADVSFPIFGSTVIFTDSSTSFTRPDIPLLGANGPATSSGGLAPQSPSSGVPGTLSLAPFLVITGCRVVMSVQYSVGILVEDGGTAIFDAFARTGLGLNVPFILARFDY